MTKIIFFLLVALSLSFLLAVKRCSHVEQNYITAQNNVSALLEGVSYYRTRDSMSVASVEKLTIDKSELQRYCLDLTEACRSLKIKLKRLQNASMSSTATTYSLAAPVRDSVFWSDSVECRRDTVRMVDYQDPWLTFSAITDRDTMRARIESRDTLLTIVHRVPRQFLFIKWGCKAIRQEVVSKNPHSRITYTRYVELKK